MNNDSAGYRVLLAQLRYLQECGHTLDWFDTEEEERKLEELAETFSVPGELRDAFCAYYKEYVSPSYLTESVFFNDEDPVLGVREKFFCFYYPMAQLLHEEFSDILFYVNVDASYDDSSTVLITADNAYGKTVLSRPILLFRDNWKAWRSFFSQPEDAQICLKELEENLHSLRANVILAMADCLALKSQHDKEVFLVGSGN